MRCSDDEEFGGLDGNRANTSGGVDSELKMCF